MNESVSSSSKIDTNDENIPVCVNRSAYARIVFDDDNNGNDDETTTVASKKILASSSSSSPIYVRRQIKETGICVIPDFILPSFVHEMVEEANALKENGFRSSESHNIFLEGGNDNDDTHNTDSIINSRNETKNTKKKTLLVRDILFSSSKTLVNQKRIAEYTANKTKSTSKGSESSSSHLLQLYEWDGLCELLRKAFSLEELYVSGDELGGVYYNFFDVGDELGWHCDNSEFSMNLIMQLPSNGAIGGDFMYLTDTRTEFFEDGKTVDSVVLSSQAINSNQHQHHNNKNNNNNPAEAFTQSLSKRNDLIIPELKPGTLYLFAGNQSLHRVSPVVTMRDRDVVDDDENNKNNKVKNSIDEEAASSKVPLSVQPRINAIFTYNRKPNEVLNEYTRKKFFGE